MRKSAYYSILVLVFLSLCQPLAAASNYSRGALDEEQRLIGSDINEADKQVQRAVSRMGADLPRTAKLSIFRAVRKLASAEGTMQNHPRHIQQLAFSIFRDEKKERRELQERFDKLDENFSEVENDLYTLIDDYDRKMGLTGKPNSLRNQVEAYRGLTRTAMSEEASEQAKAEAASKLAALNSAIDMGNETAVEQASSQLTGQGGAPAPSTSVTPTPSAPSTPSAPPSASSGGDWRPGPNGTQVRTVQSGPQVPPGGSSPVNVRVEEQKLPNGNIVTTTTFDPYTDAQGRKVEASVIKTTFPDGTSEVTTRTLTTDPVTGEVIEKISTQKYDANGNPVGEPSEQIIVRNRRGDIVSGSISLNGRVYPIGASGTPIDRRAEYAGGEGNLLLSEAEYELVYSRGEQGQITDVSERRGQNRNWDFRVSEDESRRTFNDEFTEMRTTLVFGDSQGKSNYTISSWKITDPSGATIFEGGAQEQVDVAFKTAGNHTVEVTGTTDWGTPFRITQPLQVNL